MRLVVSSAAPINTPDALATSVAAVAADAATHTVAVAATCNRRWGGANAAKSKTRTLPASWCACTFAFKLLGQSEAWC